MAEAAAYKPVLQEEGLHRSQEEAPEETQHETERINIDSRGPLVPMEIDIVRDVAKEPLFTWKRSWLPSALVALTLVIPALVGFMLLLWRLVGRIWVVAPFALHLCIYLVHCRSLIPPENNSTTTSFESTAQYSWKCVFPLIHVALDAILFFMVYAIVCTALMDLMTEPDGTTVVEWTHHYRVLQILQRVGYTAGTLRVTLLFITVLPSIACHTRLSRFMGLFQVKESDPYWNRRVRRVFRVFLNVSITVVLCILLISCASVVIHFGRWEAPVRTEGCDILDETECSLPFPSMHHMTPDSTTDTGWRVNLQGSLIPPLKGNVQIDASFLNRLDGFSTMAPMLFYIEGLKEAHENGIGQLTGAAGLANSTTSHSVTLLVDVGRKSLVAHSAEVDYLDPERPIVMVFPAKPLRHNSRYAVAVLNAVDYRGVVLPPKAGLTTILTIPDHERHAHFVDTLIPALEQAAPWFSYGGASGTLQLLFDFHTISEESQLGTVRAVRDTSLDYIRGDSWGDWNDRIRTIQIIDNECSNEGVHIARTVHAEMQVPWFLSTHGPGARHATIDYDALSRRSPASVRPVKFVVHIPCSIRQTVLDGQLDVKAVMEFGHGLFYSRAEASERFLQKMADEEKYIITAMDWRGMSVFDLLVVARVLLSSPRQFEAVRDNLIQGFSSKMALQVFSRERLLTMDWLSFEGTKSNGESTQNEASFVFYGISQGGILGAGYMGLSGGSESLIDRGILGVPGTPFALVLSRSFDFQGYDALLLLNMYHNRHVRIFLSIVQTAWDPVEASGVMASPVNEPIPRLLLQSGLGDPVVSSIAAEALARAANAVVLPNNPREVFGVPVGDAANTTSLGPHVTLTEIYYEQEALRLPVDDTFASMNHVHYCVRKDEELIKQIKEFINSGKIIDPCIDDGCHRGHAECN